MGGIGPGRRVWCEWKWKWEGYAFLPYDLYDLIFDLIPNRMPGSVSRKIGHETHTYADCIHAFGWKVCVVWVISRDFSTTSRRDA